MAAQVADIIAKFGDKSACENALVELKGLTASPEPERYAPFLIPHLQAMMDKTADKQKSVRVAAYEVVEGLAKTLSPSAIKQVIPTFVASMGTKNKPEVKECALKMLTLLSKAHPTHMAWCLEMVLPTALELMMDVKKNVKEAAMEACTEMCATSGNKDIEPFIAQMMAAVQAPMTIGECVEKLAGVVFVQTVETPALAVTTPIVTRGLKDRKEATKRRACVIIDNMVKLVPDAREVLPFLPELLPLLERATQEISDPEARGMSERAFNTMKRAQETAEVRAADPEKVLEIVQKGEQAEQVNKYVVECAVALTNARMFDMPQWHDAFTSQGFEKSVAEAVHELCFKATSPPEEEDIEEEGEDLCNTIFTLGYGSLTLLNNTRLHLKRGKCYGLLGPNDCGKTTLMRAINNEQVDGFPPKSELRTAFVEHGIGEAEPECDWLPIDYLMSEPNIAADVEAGNLTREGMIAELEKVGFKSGDKLDMKLGELSGGWKMKMGLVRAMLMNADILMLDEPTGHLDKFNIAWMIDYVNSLKTGEKPVTVIATSHDSHFLESVTTHIIDFQNRKLKVYPGTLTNFVKQVPEAEVYFKIQAAKVNFKFPEPGYLEGVKSKGKALLTMKDVEFTYPSKQTPTLHGVGVQVSMLSRVAIVGPNGAGKSTMIKCLLGELKPTKGTINKQQGARIAYMSQHAFHHIEQHLDKSGTEYILQRFAGGEDNEAIDNLAALGETKDTANQKIFKYKWINGELKECDTFFDDEGEHYPEKELKLAVKLDCITQRRNNKKTKEYECKWQGMSMDSLTWVAREQLIKMGYKKEVQREDEKIAAQQGLQNKMLTTPCVEQHLKDFGVDPEFATHNPLKALSAGQKVKIVLAAAMWQNPHVLVIDEPTNYLDRDALGALTEAIEKYNGGVVVISHNMDFCNRVATEKWIMDAGHLTAEGGNYCDEKIEENQEEEEIFDAAGNKIDVKRNKTLSDKEKKKAIKDLEKKLKENKKKKNLTEEEVWEIEDKLAELKKTE